MFIYDSTTLAFIQRAQEMLKEILIGLNFKVERTRFEFNRFLYPINVVVFDGEEWGHFNRDFLQIALNRKLIYLAQDSVVRDILKHELAHYLTHILYPKASSHGEEFRQVCRDFHFPDSVSKATMDLHESNLEKVGDLESERVIEKVKKLLSLATSSNTFEAELATLKANNLLLRHNLGRIKEKDEPLYMERILLRKRKDAKLTAIYAILPFFIVRPVISQGKGICCLEISGTLTNVKLANYVAHFLDQELDYLWNQSKRSHKLQGLRAKNSFFHGVAEGFKQKMKEAKNHYSKDDQRALTVVEQKLLHDTKIIYKRLGSSVSGQQIDDEASSVGHQKGRSLSIRNGVEGKVVTQFLT